MESSIKDNEERMTDMLLLLIKAHLSHSKNMPSGYLVRDAWMTLCSRIGQLVTLLESKKQKGKKVQAKTDQAEDLDDFNKFDNEMKDQMILPTLVNNLEKLEKQLHLAF